MTNAAAHERRNAKRVGRLASRALFVFGGAVAATAAAWLVSSPTASADTVQHGSVQAGGVTASVTPVTDATVANLGDVTRGVSQFAGNVAGTAASAGQDVSACEQDATMWSEPGHDRPICSLDPRDHIGGPHRDQVGTTVDHEVSGRVSDAVTDLGEDAILHPAQRTLGAVEHLARKPEDTRRVLDEATAPSPAAQDFGRKVWDLLDPSHTGALVGLPELPDSPLEPAAPVSAATGATGNAEQNLGAAAVSTSDALRAIFERSAHEDLNSAGSTGAPSRDDHRNLPDPFSPAQLPSAPPSIPNVPGGGSTAPGGHLDGLNFGVPAWVTAAVDNAVAGSTRAGVRHTPLNTGEQPGVTPD
ncbi:hypothetical protein [Amycolatopsis sp. FDAARGOS 1241]|uniref:hypothetical protein n=1 Tax=Amycolatopsis sp. FDAARGOS 1241 TaxID=2778070 RepID=UPI00194FEE44|nr:hypothetical protein [Amycolatopsis sp. FDAARGOS 1241]QRP46104.1 hypothetical protein I6J71_44880 [Amycolatopsis sp. FDAARGOS 1241]